MASPHLPQPDPDDLWPACDEQPPGISIRPLSAPSWNYMGVSSA
jgi:hypothetical protein